LPFPAIFFPAAAASIMMRARLWPKTTVPAKLLELGLVTLSLTVSLPLSIALFKDRCVIPAEQLEEEFHLIKVHGQNQFITNFYFNKGK